MIKHDHDLPVQRQAALVNIARSSVYYAPRLASDADLRLTRCTWSTCRWGASMLPLMWRMGITALYTKPGTSKKAPGDKIYPYLLDHLPIERANQVWATDISHIPMAKGFVWCAWRR